MTDHEQESFRFGRNLIYSKDSPVSRSINRPALTAYAVIVTVKRCESETILCHNIEDNDLMIKHLVKFCFGN